MWDTRAEGGWQIVADKHVDVTRAAITTVELPFTFTYYGQDYTQVSICSNGWVAMGSSNPGGTGDSLPRILPNTVLPNRAIFPYWDNLAHGPRFGR